MLTSADAGAVASGVVSASGAKTSRGRTDLLILNLSFPIPIEAERAHSQQLRLESPPEFRSVRRYGESRDSAVLCKRSSPVSPNNVLLHLEPFPMWQKVSRGLEHGPVVP